MAEALDGLFAIDIDDSDDEYAETAAGDAVSVPRTYQSEEAFQKQKAAYTAKIDGGTSYADLIAILPILEKSELNEIKSETDLPHLDKNKARLFASAVAELYYESKFSKAANLCRRAQEVIQLDKKTRESVDRWIERCVTRMTSDD